MCKRICMLAAVAFAAASIAAGSIPPGASAIVLKTNWNELQLFADGTGGVRVYVRKIELRGRAWKAWVGLTNRSTKRITLLAREERQGNLPYAFWAGPGLWWAKRVPGGSWWPGASVSVTHSTKAAVAPPYVSSLAPRKSWFGTFRGTTDRVPKDRLLSVGFGMVQFGVVAVDPQGRPIHHEMPLSTTHQFRLRKR
jgi:hypothetical protein